MASAPGPGPRGVVPDTRGDGRALRATWHHEAGCLVLSVWRGPVCTATVRVDPDDVPALVEVLLSGLDDTDDATRPVRRAVG